MNTKELTEELLEKISITAYGLEFLNTKNIFAFIEKMNQDNVLETLKFEESKKELRNKIAYILVSISREIIQEIKDEKNSISHKTEFIDGKWVDIYFDRKKDQALSSRQDTYSANDILFYHNKISGETPDFIGKTEVLNIFYEAYLMELSFEARMEALHRGEMDSLLDLFNDPRYEEVRDDAIFPALSDKAAEILSLDDIKFKNIEEARQAYKRDGSLETLAQLKKLHMVQAIEETEDCYDRQELNGLLNKSIFNCARRIIIKRLAYLDVAGY